MEGAAQAPIRPDRNEPDGKNKAIPDLDSRSKKKLHFSETAQQVYSSFLKQSPLKPYKHQTEALKLVTSGRNVFVDVPTGSGKTLIAEAIMFKNQVFNPNKKKKTIYTVPLKSLANEKYEEFSRKFGDKVGILTGERKENADAPILIMTTELYKMLLSNPNFRDELEATIFDEIHFIGSRDRGTAWEESIIDTPDNVQTLFLSASMNNSHDFVDWLNHIKKTNFKDEDYLHLIKSHKRLVPLEEKVVEVDTRNENQVLSFLRGVVKQSEVPTLYISFTRAGCDRLASKVASEIQAGRFTSLDEDKLKALNQEIDQILELNPELRMFTQDIENLRQGVASHHAGKTNLMKLMIEKLIDKNLLNFVFTTETLAVGINKPVKTIIMSSMRKFDGVKKSNQLIDPGLYKQISGRAGRKGHHDKGKVYILAENQTQASFLKEFYITSRTPSLTLSNYDVSYPSFLRSIDPTQEHTVDLYVEKSFAKFLQERKDALVKKIQSLRTDDYQDPEVSRLKTHFFRTYAQDIDQRLSKKEILTDVNARIEKMLEVSEKLGLITDANCPYLTNKGKMASAIRTNNPLFLTELFSDDEFFRDFSPKEFVAFISCFLYFGDYETNFNLQRKYGRSFVKNKLLEPLGKAHKAEALIRKADKVAEALGVGESGLRPSKVPDQNNYNIFFYPQNFRLIDKWTSAQDSQEGMNDLFSGLDLQLNPNDAYRKAAELKELLLILQNSKTLRRQTARLIDQSVKMLNKEVMMMKFSLAV